jgi:two-component system phosphate regulon sensor histidine kinase PhoR
VTLLLYWAACVANPSDEIAVDIAFNNLFFLFLTGIISTIAVQFGINRRFEEFRLGYELEKRNKELDRSNKELAELDRLKSHFFANVSHELRTPLTALSGFIETLRGPARDDAEARDRFLDIMEREAARMNRLVHDLLSLSRVEDTERMRPTDRVDIARILSSVVIGLGPLAEGREVTLVARGCEAPVELPGDADQLTQVFTNLVENGIKYGREGGTVTLNLIRHDSLPALRGPGVTVEVTDEGEGISQRHLARLTERFYRVDSHRSRGMGGTGLGLAIVKHIVNRHRGRLRISSEPGQGSCFAVSLPLTTTRLG